MEQIDAVVDVLKNWRKYSSPDSTRGRSHSGLKHIKGHEELAANTILQRDWNGKKAVSSMYKMAQSVDLLLGLNLDWKQRTDLARLLLSSLTYSRIYKLAKANESNPRSAFTIFATEGGLLPKRSLPDKTSFTQFPMWYGNVDQAGNLLIKPCKPQAPENEHKPQIPEDPNIFDEDSVPWLHAVRVLEGVGFRINEPFLRLVEQLDANPSTRLIHQIPPDYEESRQALDDQRTSLDMDELDRKYRNKEDRTTEGERVRTTWWKQHYLLEQRKQGYDQRYKRFHEQLVHANRLKGKVFYHRLEMCHRGRIYYPAEFSIQGSDFARAVIEFDESAELYKEGWLSLLLHAQNVSDGSADHDVKSSRADDRFEEFLEIALDPVANFDNWKDADKPFCFLRSCLEIYDAVGIQMQSLSEEEREKSSEEERQLVDRGLERWKSAGQGEVKPNGDPVFNTRLPIEMDQSNSAYQHIALMMQDESLMTLANMGESYSDLYSKVADHPDLQIDGLDDPKEKRKIVKLVSIPWGYGSGWESCADDLDEFRRDKPDKAQYLWTLEIQEINRLARRVIRILEENFDACVRFRDMVKWVVAEVEKSGQKDKIEFLTPTMFNMVIRKCAVTDEKNSPQVEVWNGEKNVDLKVREPLGVQWYSEGGQKSIQNAAPASLVHSMDASLVHGIVAMGRFKEVRDGDALVMQHKMEDWIWYPLATCHDAFFCLAPHVEDLKQRLEEGLLGLYRTFDPLKSFAAQNLTPGRPYNPSPFKTGLKTGKNIFD
jgi:hypothetical protein